MGNERMPRRQRFAKPGQLLNSDCYITLLKRIGAARSAYVGVMVPVVALVVSVFFEQFDWGWLTSVGVTLLIGGNILMLRQPAAVTATD